MKITAMKKIFIVLFILITSVLTLHAQAKPYGGPPGNMVSRADPVIDTLFIAVDANLVPEYKSDLVYVQIKSAVSLTGKRSFRTTKKKFAELQKQRQGKPILISLVDGELGEYWVTNEY